jgi:gamma-glutamylcyclotransferase (GGCT)/AIG2-like uncharacterized protein YtfP
MVEGEFVRVADPSGTIMALDSIEGFAGYHRNGSLYRRTLIGVDGGEGCIRQAWTYRCARNSEKAPEIVSGNWRMHIGCHESFLCALIAEQMPASLSPMARRKQDTR